MSRSESSFRSFSLYNIRGDSINCFPDHTYANSGEKRYSTLGYFDEFRTKSVAVEKKNGDMPELWETINKMNSELIDSKNTGSYSSKSYQNIFGFPFTYIHHKKDSEYEGRFVSDEEFWQDDNYLYIFTILVQFFDSNGKEINKDLLKHKIDTYIRKYIEHIGINFEKYNDVFSVRPDIKEGDEDYGFARKAHDILPEFSPNEEDKDYILTDYLTFDRYDYILCVKSRCYMPFVLATQQLHSLFYASGIQRFSSVESFTVTAINHDYSGVIADEIIPSICIKCNYAEDKIFLYNLNLLDQLKEEEQAVYLPQDKFNVLNFMHTFQEELKEYLYEEEEIKKYDKFLDNYFKMYYISGENDARFISRYVHIGKIISLLTSVSSPLRKVFLSSFSTSINVTNNDYKLFQPNQVTDQLNTKLYDKIKECKEMICKLSEKKYPTELIKIMHQVNSGLSAIMPRNTHYRGYGFFSLFPDFYDLIKRTYLEMLSIEKSDLSIITLEKVQDLIQFLGAALLTTIRSDFKEFQVPTFNANLYYTPTKLLVFYRAYIMFFMEYYAPFYEKSSEKYGTACAQRSEQHFIIAPGNKFGATVYEKVGGIYENEKLSERFFTCEISEKSIYLLKHTLTVLSHEISHYGLKTIRKRKERYLHIKNTYIYAFLDYLLLSTTQKISEIVQKVDKAKSDSRKNGLALYRLINGILNKELKSELFEKIHDLYCFYEAKNKTCKKNKYHYDNTILVLESIFFNIKSEIGESVFDTVYSNLQEELYKTKDFGISDRLFLNESLKRAITESIELSYQTVFLNRKNKAILSVHNFISYYYEEVFSDLLCLLTLNISPEEYIASIIEERSYKNDMGGEMHDRTMSYRIFLVVESLNKALEKLSMHAESDQENNGLYGYAEKLFDFGRWKEDNQSFVITKEYRSVKERQFDVFAVPINDPDHLRWYKEINVERVYPIRSLFYEMNISQNIIEYMTDCIIAYFEQMRSNGIDTKGLSPRMIYDYISSEEKNYDEKILCIDSFLSKFENYQMIKLGVLPDPSAQNSQKNP